MEPSQKTKDQRTRSGNQPRRPGNFPPALDQDEQGNETVPFSNTAQPLSSEEDPQRDSYERHDREIDQEGDRMMSLSEGDEEPKINSKKKNFGKRESFEEQEGEEGEEGRRTPTNFFSLSESLKAMKNLRNNFQSFELEVDAKDFEGAGFEDANKEILEEEEDYIKVDSVEDEQIKELDYDIAREEHEDEYYEEEIPEKQPRALHNQFIEKIQEEAQEESRREEEEQEVNRNDEDQLDMVHVSSGDKILDAEDLVEPPKNEGFDLEGTEIKEEKILQNTEDVANEEEEEENKKVEEDIELKPVAVVEQLGDIEEKKEDILVESEVVPEVIENKQNVDDEKKRFLEEFESGGVEKEPEPQQESIPEVREVVEEPPLEKPPIFMPVKKTQEAKNKDVEKPKRAAPFMPRAIPEQESFVPPVQITANLNVEANFVLTSESPAVVEEEVDLQGMNEDALIVYLKKIQVELKKEKRMNHILENEHKKVMTENTELKKEVFIIKSKFEALEKSKESEKLARKDQQTIEKLQEELNNTIEASRLAKEQSNKLMKDSLQLKQDMESMIESLTEENKQQDDKIRELKSLLHKESLKNETLSQEVTHYQQRVKDYEESFDLIRKQSREREKTVKELTSLSETSVNTLQNLPKIEDIVEKLQPQRTTIGVQTSLGQTMGSKDHSFTMSRRSEQEEQPKSTKFSSENKPSFAPKTTKSAWALKPEPEVQKKEVVKEEPKSAKKFDEDDLELLMENITTTKKEATFPKIKKVEVKEKEHQSPMKPSLQKPIEVEKETKEHHHQPQISPIPEEKKAITTKEKEESSVKKEPTILKMTKPQTIESASEEKIEKKQEPSISLAQEKPQIITFPKLPAAEEIKKKPMGGLVLNKNPTVEPQKSPLVIGNKPALTVNLNNIQNKSSSRYTTQVKTINKNTVSIEADNFFDELGISDTPQSRGGLRESVTSLRSSTSKQGGESSTKKSLNLNNFV